VWGRWWNDTDRETNELLGDRPVPVPVPVPVSFCAPQIYMRWPEIQPETPEPEVGDYPPGSWHVLSLCRVYIYVSSYLTENTAHITFTNRSVNLTGRGVPVCAKKVEGGVEE
jgi:hypothetical protein